MSLEIIGLIIGMCGLALTLAVHATATSRKNGQLEERLNQTAARQKEDRDAFVKGLRESEEARARVQKDDRDTFSATIARESLRHAEVDEKRDNRHEEATRELIRKHEADIKEITSKIERWAERDAAQDTAKQKHLEDKIDRLMETINHWGQALVGLDSRVRTVEKVTGVSGQTAAVLPQRSR